MNPDELARELDSASGRNILTLMKRKRETIGVLARMWFAVTPQERALLLAILAVALIGLTARYLRQRTAAPDNRPIHQIEEIKP